MNRTLIRLVCLAGAMAGLLLAIAGMFTFKLWQIVPGLVLYVVSGYIWEQRVAGDRHRAIDR